jgi:transposase
VKGLSEEIRGIEKTRRESIETQDTKANQQIKQLTGLCGIGIESATQLVRECFSWRPYMNRKKAGALVGLTGTPYDSGSSQREQGISKAGSRRLRCLLIELSWQWLRYQPTSQLTQWYASRFAGSGNRGRKIGIVALARKLFILLWKYIATGALPAGVKLKGC